MGQGTGAMEDKEDGGAISSDNLHQTVDFAQAPAPCTSTACALAALLPTNPTLSRSRIKERIEARYVCRQGRGLEM